MLFHICRLLGQKDPQNPKILRDLGRAYYHKGCYDKSTECLNQACRFDSLDLGTVLYLGLNYERMEDYVKAREVYQEYLKICNKPKAAKKISARLSYFNLLEIKKQIRDAVRAESTVLVDTSQIPENSITVLYFENLSRSDQRDPLSKGIAELLITDLSKVKKLRVIERIRLQALLDELALSSSDLVDPATAPRVGRILKVENVIKGALEKLEENLRMVSGAYSVPADTFEQLKSEEGKLSQFFHLEKELVFGIIDHLQITLTKEERDEIEKVPTEDMTAFLAYCEGLDCEDKGDYTDAARQFKQALSSDPNFSQAREAEKRSRDFKEAGMPISQFEDACISIYEKGSEAQESRLKGSAGDVTGNFIPDDPNAPPQDKTEGSTSGRVPRDGYHKRKD